MDELDKGSVADDLSMAIVFLVGKFDLFLLIDPHSAASLLQFDVIQRMPFIEYQFRFAHRCDEVG